MASGTGNTSPALTVSAILLLIWAVLSYIARIWTKVGKRDAWSLDDTVISASLVIAFVQVATIFSAVHHGYGHSWAEFSSGDREAAHIALYVSQILFVISMGLTRASVAFFSGRVLAMDNGLRPLSIFLISTTFIWTAASVCAIALRAPLSEPWVTLEGSSSMFYRWLIIEVIGVLVDLSMLLVAIRVIWTLQMTFKKRMAVTSIFAARILVVAPVVAVRLWSLRPLSASAQATPSLVAGILTEAELLLALFLASATGLKPFLQPFHPGFFVTNKPLTGSGYSTKIGGSRNDAYYELSKPRSDGGGNTKQSVGVSAIRYTQNDDSLSDEVDLIEPHGKPEAVYRPDYVEHRSGAQAVAGSRETRAPGIARTKDFSITYD